MKVIYKKKASEVETTIVFEFDRLDSGVLALLSFLDFPVNKDEIFEIVEIECNKQFT